MPILEVEMTLSGGEELPGGLAAKIADAAGEVFGTPRGRTWVKLSSLPLERYAENGEGGAPEGMRPVFVSVLLARRPEPKELAPLAAKLTARVAEACERPAENVHLFFEPEGTGRVSFGGNLVGGE